MQQQAQHAAAHDQKPTVRSIAVMHPVKTPPSCECTNPPEWPKRRLDGRFDEDLYDVLFAPHVSGPVYEQRTCMCCGATKSIEVAT